MIGATTQVYFDGTDEPIQDVTRITVCVSPRERITANVTTLVRGEDGKVIIAEKEAVVRKTQYTVAYVCLAPSGYKVLKVIRDTAKVIHLPKTQAVEAVR